MTRVIIADDEVLVRIGLKAAIDWEKNGFVIVDEVGNGWNALARVRAGEADILLLDIRMPLMDGIEVLKAIRQDNLPVKVIILSVHEEKMYVQEALALGAFDYMLKLSLDPDRLLKTLCRARKALDADAGRLPATKQNIAGAHEIWRSLIERYDDRLLGALRENGSRLTGGRIALLFIREDTPSQQPAADQPPTSGALVSISQKFIESIISDTINNYAAGDCVQWEDGRYIAVIHPRQANADYLHTVASVVIQSVKKFTNIGVSIGVSEVRDGLQNVKEALLEAEAAVESCYVRGTESVCLAEDAAQRTVEPELFSAEDEKRYLAALSQANLPEALETLKRFGEAVRRHPGVPKRILIDKAFDITMLARQEMRECGVRLENHSLFMGHQPRQHIESFAYFTETEAFLEEFTRVCAAYLDQKRLENTQHKAVGEAKAFIEKNLCKPLNMDILSRQVNLSKNHLSHLFKKETGETMSAFILRLRIEHSKTLLSGTSLSVSEIAERCSFNDIYYFSNSFKKRCGVNPTEYRKQYMNKSPRNEARRS